MFRRACRMVLASGLTLFALTACSSDEPEEHAECRQGDMREEACGLYGTSIQRQVCGPRFRWIHDGPCVDKAVCEHNETQTELCGVTGELLCWGNNASGQVGDGTQTNRTSPTPL